VQLRTSATHSPFGHSKGRALSLQRRPERQLSMNLVHSPSGHRKGSEGGHARSGGQSRGERRHVLSQHLNGTLGEQVTSVPQRDGSACHEPSAHSTRRVEKVDGTWGHAAAVDAQDASTQRTGRSCGQMRACGQAAIEEAHVVPPATRGQTIWPRAHASSGERLGSTDGHEGRHEPSTQRVEPGGQVMPRGHRPASTAQPPPGQRAGACEGQASSAASGQSSAETAQRPSAQRTGVAARQVAREGQSTTERTHVPSGQRRGSCSGHVEAAAAPEGHSAAEAAHDRSAQSTAPAAHEMDVTHAAVVFPVAHEPSGQRH
jgi:hypothetical protein